MVPWVAAITTSMPPAVATASMAACSVLVGAATGAAALEATLTAWRSAADSLRIFRYLALICIGLVALRFSQALQTIPLMRFSELIP